MFKSLVTWPSKFIKFPGLKYGEPKVRYATGEEVNKPVVLIFGWLGATERYLSKYTQLYQEKGYETIHYIPPMGLIFFPSRIPDLNAQIQADLVRIMKEKGLLRRPFLLHIFSNSGYINWMFFQRYIRKQLPNNAYNIYYRLQGSVIDSAPCNLDPSVLARGFMGALFPKIDGHKHPILTPIMEFFWSLFLRLNGNPEAFADVNKLMNRTILPYPQTYLFSSGDSMIYASEIKKHMARIQRRTNLPSSSLDFVTSNHVAHYRVHPTAYSKKIDSVLENVEKNWTVLLETLAHHSNPVLPLRPKGKAPSRSRTSLNRSAKLKKQSLKKQEAKSL